MGWLSIFGGAVKLFTALLGLFRDKKLREEGAAEQRDTDMRAENDRLDKASNARNSVRIGSGLPVESDPANRDNR